ncbi:MAG: adenosylmethionine decarboxylase [bacterium]|nr:adenosylmethionine decarboxylase [bacterium]
MRQIQRRISRVGVHVIADFWGGRVIKSTRELKTLLARAAKKGENTPLKFALHKFSPQGITGVVLLAESHIALHTWPEFKYTAIDIFTCGKKSKPEEALKFLQGELRPKRMQVRKIKRGNAL